MEAAENNNNVVKRLEELTLGIEEEPQLSEDQLTINNQLQEDELLAVEAIYGDNFIILSRDDELRSFQIHACIETPHELAISAELDSSSENCESEGKLSSLIVRNQDSNQHMYTFKVKYLPPVVLTCLLPRTYPSHLPPYFTISVQWLDSMRISNLCHMLDSIWMKQPREEVIYQWVECLHSSSLSYLGIDREIGLGPYGFLDTADRRAISESVSQHIDILSIMNYNNDKCHEVFCESLHECCICFSEYAGIDFMSLPCNHFFCTKCLRTYVRIHVKEGTVKKLSCPDIKCRGLVPPSLLKSLLAEEEFERWESLLLQKTLLSMPDIVYCPRCETVCLDDEEKHAQCPTCLFSFCSLCSDRRHVGSPCIPPELKLSMLQEQQESPNLQEEQKHRVQEIINNIRSVKEVLRDSTQCPSCKMAVSRISGCNHMTCTNCGQHFCYDCGKYYDFRLLHGCTRFREVRLVPQVRRKPINERREVARLQAETLSEHAHSCPLCGQLNAKKVGSKAFAEANKTVQLCFGTRRELEQAVANNNHIYCWSCLNHYCYLCRKLVRNSSQHYTSKGCKQHTPG